MTPLLILINREHGDWDPALEPLLRAAAEAGFPAGLRATGQSWAGEVEIGITLADDLTVQALNRDHRNQDKPTNVLSFPLADLPLIEAPLQAQAHPPGAPLLLGDVILAFETVAAEAHAQGKSLADHAVHLVVHGVLHLLGADHRTEAEALVMERLETTVLAGLGVTDPYREPPPTDGPAPEPRELP